MISLVHPTMRARFDQLMLTANVRTTFVMSMDSLSEQLAGLRKCELFFDDAARADRKLLDMPTLMLARSTAPNAVLVCHPELNWLDITDITYDELQMFSRGIITPNMFSTPIPQAERDGMFERGEISESERNRHASNEMLGQVFGALFNSIFNPRPRP